MQGGIYIGVVSIRAGQHLAFSPCQLFLYFALRYAVMLFDFLHVVYIFGHYIMKGDSDTVVQHLFYFVPVQPSFHEKAVIILLVSGIHIHVLVHPLFFCGQGGGECEPDLFPRSVSASQSADGREYIGWKVSFSQMGGVVI